MEPLKVAVLGYGRSGSSLHADPIEALPDFQMTAVCDIDVERRREAADRFGCRTYVDYREMLQKEDLQLVSVVTRSDQHCEMTCECLRAGTDVLVTKPWCVDETEAQRMIGAAEESGRRIFPWLPARWGSVYRRVRQVVKSGEIGRVFCVRRAAGGFGSRNDWQTQTRYGGGYLLNWGPHIVDTAVMVAGERVQTVYGWMKQVLIPGDAEDVFFADMSMNNGIRVLAERTVAIENPPSWYVQGNGGTLIARGMELTLYRGQPPSPVDPTNPAAMQAPEPEVGRERIGGAQWGDAGEIYSEVAAALRDETDFPVSTDDALELTRILDAIRRSSERNEVVELF